MCTYVYYVCVCACMHACSVHVHCVLCVLGMNKTGVHAHNMCIIIIRDYYCYNLGYLIGHRYLPYHSIDDPVWVCSLIQCLLYIRH